MRYSIISLVFIVILTSCEYRQSVNKDLVTGANSRGNGLECAEVLIEIDKKVAKRKEFVFGEEVKIIFNDVVGLKKENSMVFPGVSLYILNSKKDTVQASPDFLKDSKGMDLSPLQLKVKFMAVFPRKEQYKVHINIWDKKGDGNFSYQLPFTVKDSRLLKVQSNEIEFSNIYLWNQTKNKPVINKIISQEDTFILILENLKGFNEIEGNVFPVFSIELIDSKGNTLLSNPNLLKEVAETGVGVNTLFRNQLTANISFNNGAINNPYIFKAIIKDGKSTKELNISAELELKNFSFN